MVIYTLNKHSITAGNVTKYRRAAACPQKMIGKEATSGLLRERIGRV